MHKPKHCVLLASCVAVWDLHARGDDVLADWHGDWQWLAGSIPLALMPNYKGSSDYALDTGRCIMNIYF